MTEQGSSLTPPRGLLVSGDAGIGKTTVVQAVASEAAAGGFSVAFGHCVDVSGGMPFGPVTEALRQLAGADVELPTPESPTALAVLVDLATDLTSARPTLLVLEDMHWADRLTADFVIAFLRTVRTRAVVALTYRTEDVQGSDPMTAALVELRRTPGLTRLDLGPLGAGALQELAVRRSGRRLDRRQVRALLAKAQGNPLYAEELLDAESESVPLVLADLLMRHVRTLSPSTRSLVRLASAAGSLVDVETLRAVSGLGLEPVESALREALDANVLVRHNSGLAFRHALLRDAVYADLLPTERRRLHVRYVQVLTHRLAQIEAPVERWPLAADLAHHATDAGDLAVALRAHVTAARASSRFGARAEPAHHYEAALALWDSVPETDRPPDVTKADLACSAAGNYFTLGQPHRIRQLLRDAISWLGEGADPLTASRVYAAAARLPHGPRDVLSDEEAAARALTLAGDEPSSQRVEALEALAYVEGRKDHFERVIEAVETARHVAGAAGLNAETTERGSLKAWALWYLGRCEEGVESLVQAANAGLEAGDAGNAIEAMADAAWLRMLRGDANGCLELARRARHEARRLGLRAREVEGGEREVLCLVATGDLQGAQALLQELSSQGLVEYRYREMATEVDLALGDVEAARRHDTYIADLFPDLVYALLEDIAVRRAALLGALGDARAEAAWAAQFADTVAGTDSPLRSAVSAYLSIRAMSSLGYPDLEPLRDRAYADLQFAQSRLSPSWDRTWYAALLSYAQAYAARLEGRPALEHWAQGVERATRIGAYVALQPRLELSAEHLRVGDRATGKEMLVSVWQDAHAMGAGWYERTAADVAHRNRVPLRTDEQASLHRLTPREREVLGLLASGATDRDIADALVISRKTASVHVSNILSKLEVANRSAAGARARQLGIDSPTQQ